MTTEPYYLMIVTDTECDTPEEEEEEANADMPAQAVPDDGPARTRH